MKPKILTLLPLAEIILTVFLLSDAYAQFNFGGYTFPDRSAFADEAVEVGSPPSGAGLLPFGTTSISTALTDVNLNTWVIAGGSAGMADVRFTDNVIVNESGPDFVVFEYGAGDSYRIAVSQDGTASGLTAFRNYAGTQAIDLSDFGLAEGVTVTLIRIQPNLMPGTGAGEWSADIQDIGALHSRASSMVSEKFDFNDGTVQGWTLTGAFDENGRGPFSSNFSNGWQDAVSYSNAPGVDPMGDQKGSLRLATLGGHGITNSGATWWIMQLHSPDLTDFPTWQSAKGYSVEIAECMASFGAIYANLYVTVYDQDQARNRTFYSGTALALTHDVYGDGNANWNHLQFDWSAVSGFPTHYTVKEIFINLWGHMAGTYYEGGVYVDEVTPLVEEGPQPPAAPSNLQAYQTVPQIHITWQDNSDDETGFRLEYKNGLASNWAVLAELGPNVISYQMDDPLVAQTYVFRVAAMKEGVLSAYSNMDTLTYRLFLSWLRVDTPNGGEVWPVGSTQKISWSAGLHIYTPYALSYSTDGGSHWIDIATVSADSSYYTWPIPNTPSDHCIVKVNCAGLYDLTDHSFTITADIPVLSVTPLSRNVSASTGTTTFAVANAGGGTLHWTAEVTEGNAWLSISSGSSGINTGTVTIVYTANPNPSPRTGKITITAGGASGSPCEVTVSQAGSGTPSVTVKIQPASKTIFLNDTGKVHLVIEGVNNLGSFQFEIGFHGDVVQVNNSSHVVLGPFLGSTGRTVIPVGPTIDNPAGTVVYGAATMGTQNGPNGNGILATLTWTATGEGTTTLDLRHVQVSDIHGVAIPVSEVDGEVIVEKSFWADVNSDGRIDIIDIQLVCAHWNTRVGDPGYDPRFDLDNGGEGDGDIDIIDIQLVASWWNKPIPSSGSAIAKAVPKKAIVELSRGESADRLEILVKGASELGGFQFDLLASEPVGVQSFEPGSLWQQTENAFGRLGPVRDASQKRITMGVYSYGVSPGTTGDGVLARVFLEKPIPVKLDRVLLVDTQGNPIELEIVQAKNESLIPQHGLLYSNYPNPFNAETRIRFEIPGNLSEKKQVKISVWTPNGQWIRTLIHGDFEPGMHEITWDGTDQEGRVLSSGLYICLLELGSERLVQKMALIK